jgi:hypothetical protein
LTQLLTEVKRVLGKDQKMVFVVTNPKHMGHGVEIVSRYRQDQPEENLWKIADY